jgi:hypothetical protein
MSNSMLLITNGLYQINLAKKTLLGEKGFHDLLKIGLGATFNQSHSKQLKKPVQ